MKSETITHAIYSARYDDPEEAVFVASTNDVVNATAIMHALQANDDQARYFVRNVLASPASVQMISRLLRRIRAFWKWADRIPDRHQLESDMGETVPLHCIGTDVAEAEALVDAAKGS